MSTLRKASHSQLIHPLAKSYPNKYCKWCGRLLPKYKRSFCSKHCVEEWSIRTSPSFLRLKVFNRDKGVCAECGLDTEKLKARIYAKYPKNKLKRDKLINRIGFNKNRALWEADHIKSVLNKGGLCGLDNMQTLCYRCHLKKTKKDVK